MKLDGRFAKIGKSLLIQAVGIQPNFKKVESLVSIDENICKCFDCDVYKAKIEIRQNDSTFIEDIVRIEKEVTKIENHSCTWNCPNGAVTTLSKTKYYNEKNQYGDSDNSSGDDKPKSDRLTSLQLKQLLLFHLFPIGSNGIIKGLSIKEIAKILNCTTKSVKSSNIRLVDRGYIWITKVDSDKFNLLICGYKNYHLTASQGGRGYIQVSERLLKEIISITNVNALRLEIRKLVEWDNQNIGDNKGRSAEFSNEDIKRMLPNHINYQGAINNVLSHKSSAFVTMQKEDGIKFILKESYNSDKIIEKLGYKYLDKFNELLDDNSVSIDHSFKQDLIQMSFQYDFESVYVSAEKTIEVILKGTKVPNFGGYVREITRKKLRLTQAS